MVCYSEDDGDITCGDIYEHVEWQSTELNVIIHRCTASTQTQTGFVYAKLARNIFDEWDILGVMYFIWFVYIGLYYWQGTLY